MKKYGKFRKTYRRSYKGSSSAYRRIKRSKRRYSRGRSLKQFKRQLNKIAEKKYMYIDNVNDGQGIDIGSTNNVFTLAGILKQVRANVTQGSGIGQRNGNKIFLRYIVIKGAFYNTITSTAGTNQSETGMMHYWIYKEHKKDTLAENKKRIDVLSAYYAQIEDWTSKGYKPIKKWGKFMQGMVYTTTNNTVTTGTTKYFKFKIPVFKTMEFIGEDEWLVNGKHLEYIGIPFVAANNYNRSNNGVTCDSALKVTYTDV